MKKLPKLYRNNISKPIKNNKEICYLNREVKEEKRTVETVEEVLSKVFNGMGYSYNIPVIITTKNKTYYTSIVTKTKQAILTLENEIIPLKDITEIKIEKRE